MNTIEAVKTLTTWDQQGRYVYSTSDLAKIVDDPTPAAFRKTIERLVTQDVLVRAARGVYVFAYSRHLGPTTIEDVALTLRRGEYVFESLESALSQWGRISQIPLDRITLMTTGRRGEYRTPYGVIEFTHTGASPTEIQQNIIDRRDIGHPIPIANEEYALRNLRRVGRNRALVTETDRKESRYVEG
ncbi:MAG: hypothetical protein FWG78_00025 [Coriobacteriia bacterium]|nr:hypothetical protein [Coriobacteriia bacterium]